MRKGFKLDYDIELYKGMAFLTSQLCGALGGYGYVEIRRHRTQSVREWCKSDTYVWAYKTIYYSRFDFNVTQFLSIKIGPIIKSDYIWQ